ncbi:DarT ssDNA thymidine ADP-ribosyltransferase family protein [Secundilactobacillus muriivasis]
MNPRKRTYWPRFAFHFTDINNAVSILKHRCLVSRNRAIAQGWMSNDNASQSVISTTSSVVENQVRLYFRPRTPTQFHNEGFKTKLARNDGRVSANCPIPVFFLFDLSQVLALSNSKFSMMT